MPTAGAGRKAVSGGSSYQVIEDLLADDADHLKGLLGGDRVDQQIAVDADEMLRVENAVLVLNEHESGLRPGHEGACMSVVPVRRCR